MPRSVTYNQYLSAPAANDAWTVPTNTTRCKQTCKLCLVMFHMKSAIRNTIHVSESFREKMHTTYPKVSNYILVNGQGEGVICYSMCPFQVLFSPPTFWIWTNTTGMSGGAGMLLSSDHCHCNTGPGGAKWQPGNLYTGLLYTLHWSHQAGLSFGL